MLMNGSCIADDEVNAIAQPSIVNHSINLSDKDFSCLPVVGKPAVCAIRCVIMLTAYTVQIPLEQISSSFFFLLPC